MTDREMAPLTTEKPPMVRAKTQLLHLPRSKAVDVLFQDVKLKVSTGFFYNKRSKVVLKGVSGKFCSGELTAIMGPSGAGKSSLLNILTGFQREGMRGRITCSNRAQKGQELLQEPLDRKDCCYIMQDDNLTPLLTTREIMLIAANLKLSQKMTQKAKVLLIEDILENVGLSHTMHTQSGRLSGGQRKRLSVALELINNPPVMFLDEPTTGLDSSSTLQIVTLLKSLARGGRNVICTLHQPSASIFEMFDHVYIIGHGYCMYQGSSKNMLPFLQSIGLPCPQYHNPADFVLDVVSGEFGDHSHQLADAATNSIWRDPPPALLPSKDMNGMDGISHTDPPSETYKFTILLKRSLTLMFRDWTVVYLKLILHIVVGLLVGTLFHTCGSDGNKSINNVGYFMASAVYLSYTSLMPAILKFPTEFGVIKKEQFNNWYKLRTYYVAFQITNLPLQMAFAFLYIGISYFMTSQIMERDRFLRLQLVLVISIVVSECLGLGLGTATNPVNGLFLGSIGICFMILMAGFLALVKDMPRILSYFTYFSYMKYTLEGMTLAIYSYGRKNLPCDIHYCHYRSPLAVLDELQMRHGNYWQDVAALVVMAFFSFWFAYFSLRAKMKWT